MKDWKLAVVVGAMMLAGVVVGAQVFGAQPATAQEAGWRECFFGMQEAVDINGESVVVMPERNRTISVPLGYTVVSGAGGGNPSRGYVLFCRR